MDLVRQCGRALLMVTIAALCACSSAHAQNAGESVRSAVDTVLDRLRATYPKTTFNSVRATDIPGVFEVVMGKNVAYTDASGRYFLFGNLMDMQTQKNLTHDRLAEVTRVDPSQFKLADAIKTVKGDGSRVLYVFADPECGYCKQLEKTLLQLPNTTVYTFLLPVLGPRSQDRAKSIWCSKDRAAAWGEYMSTGNVGAGTDCETPLQRNLALGDQLAITGTPTIVTAAGTVHPGALPLDRLEALLGTASKSAKAMQ